MTQHVSNNPSSIVPHRTLSRPQKSLLSIALALLALAGTWAAVLAYNTTLDLILQCEDSDISPSIMSCHWINSQFSGALWVEGAAIPQFIEVAGLSAAATDVHSYTWSVSWSDQVVYHGYDWLVSYDQARQLHQDYVGSSLDLNQCTGGNGAQNDMCNNLHATGYSQTIEIPDDTFISGSYVKNGQVLPRIQAFEAKYGNRTMTIWTDQPLTGTAVVSFYHADDAANFPPIFNGGDAGGTGTLIRYTVAFTGAVDAFMLEYGAHFAISGNPYADPMAWGWDELKKGYGAGGLYPSAPWHVKDHTIDGGAGNIGSKDMQAKLQNANLYPITSNSAWNPITKRFTDTITMTTSTTDPIAGTVDFWVCADNTPLYTDTLTFGCTTTTTATYVGSSNVSYAGGTAVAVSPQFSPTLSGRYCFLAIFMPAKNGNTYNYPPTADTNNTTECMTVGGPNAVTLNKFQASPGGDGAPIIAILLSLLAVVAGAALWRLKTKRRSTVA